MEDLYKLVLELCKYPNETQWLEFKRNNYTPEIIGQDISALANGAALEEKPKAYFVWGVDDNDHSIVGTEYNLLNLKKGNEELETWLRRMLSPGTDFTYETVLIDGHTVGVMTINRALNTPVDFSRTTYIRVGSYTKKLAEHPALQARLWKKLQAADFETQPSKQNLEIDDALRLLDYSAYFDHSGIPAPSSGKEIAHYLCEEGIMQHQDNGCYAITNMGALLLAKKLSDFQSLLRKAVRVVQYEGNNRLNMVREETINKGYVAGFESLMMFITALIPAKELIISAQRETMTTYPLIAIRETIANALIHQDFSLSGAGPIVELFQNRIEVTNPGVPLISIERIIDNPPRSRNDRLSSFMRRMRMCEELGTGWDKIVISCEAMMLPAPKIDCYEESTKVTLYSEVPFAALSAEERLRSCYLHACIKQVQGEYLTNASLRNRFGVSDSSAGSISRLIREAIEKQLIKPLDPTTSNKYKKYMPWWA